jgi:hypothetical protein
MSTKEVVIFSILLVVLMVSGFFFLGMVDQLGQQFLKVGLDQTSNVGGFYVSK